MIGAVPHINRTFLFMTRIEWAITSYAAMLLSLIAFPWYDSISWWIGAGVFITTMFMVNLCLASRYCIPFPQLAALIAFLQLIIASWLTWYYPSHHSHYDIGMQQLPSYLAYAVPACIFFVIGMCVPLIFLVNLSKASNEIGLSRTVNVYVARDLNKLIMLGTAAYLLESIVPAGLHFILVLLGYVRYVGLFGYVLLGIPGWKHRAYLVFALELVIALASGFFHQIVLWSAIFVLILAYKNKWGKWTLVFLIVGFFSVVSLQGIKQEYRKQLWSGQSTRSGSNLSEFTQITIDYLTSPLNTFSPEYLPEVLKRLNQGWIVNMVMVWTPSNEPFAEGATLVSSIGGSLLPRFINPLKFSASDSRLYFTKYTGHVLSGGTTMGLGYAGEMYANFGYWGGIIGVCFYGLFIGTIFRWFYVRSLSEPLWWAWATYFAIVVVKAETNIGQVVNWTVKAAVIMTAIIWLLPNLRQRLWFKPNKSNGRSDQF